MLALFGWLARARRLRGGFWDVFGRLPERRLERQLVLDYEDDVATILAVLAPATLEASVALASLPEQVRGFGPVKAGSVRAMEPQRRALRARLSSTP